MSVHVDGRTKVIKGKYFLSFTFRYLCNLWVEIVSWCLCVCVRVGTLRVISFYLYETDKNQVR